MASTYVSKDNKGKPFTINKQLLSRNIEMQFIGALKKLYCVCNITVLATKPHERTEKKTVAARKWIPDICVLCSCSHKFMVKYNIFGNS